MKSAQKMKLKRLIVAVASSEARMDGLPQRKRTPATTWPLSASSVGGSSGRDRAEKERRDEVAEGVHGQRERRLQDLDEDASDARPGDVREGAAADEERVRLDVVSRGTIETKSELYETWKNTVMAPDEERDDVELREDERVERVGERNRRDQGSATQIGRDHDPAPAAMPVDPGARVQREEEVRHQLGRDQVAHLRLRSRPARAPP